jgi:hypothetical protein
MIELGPTASASPKTDAHRRRQRRALRVIERLDRLCSDYPEFRRILEDPIDLMKHEAKRTPASDRQLILNAIHTGAWTMKDIQDEVKLSRADIQKHLDQMLAAGIIIEGHRNEKNENGGRPTGLWIPAPNVIPIPPIINPEK